MNPVNYMENIICTNPCFSGDMRILTTDGYKTFEEIENKTINIINENGDISETKIWCSGEKDTYNIRLSNGHIIKTTKEHKFKDINGEAVEAIDLKGRKLMPNINYTTKKDNEYIKLGFIQGDGNLTRIKSPGHTGLEINIGYKDLDILKLFSDENMTQINSRAPYLNGINNKLTQLGFCSEQTFNRIFPTTYKSWDLLKKSSFLQGCFSANGSVVSKHRIQYKSTSKKFIEELKETLFSDFGISSNITVNKEKENKFSNGTYICKESYDLCINKYEDIQKFKLYISFYHNYKIEALNTLLINRAPKVTSVKFNKNERVFDFTEPKTHWGIIENYIIHNCGEYISGILHGDNIEDSNNYWGACNLGSLFLHNFINNPFTENAEIDWKLLKDTIDTGVETLDNIIDLNYYPLKEFENYQKNMRVIGMGITGLADAMTMLNIKYGSETSVKFTEKIMNFIVKNQFRKSIELAKEKGSFPFLNKEKYANCDFIKSMIEKDSEWKEIKNDILKYGIRNARHTSIAPTGTLSMAFGDNCSSGIEPIFSLEYDRKVKIGGQNDDNIEIIKFRDYAYDLWLETENNIVDKNMFVTALDMPVEDHTKILCTIANYTNMAISKTINIPENYSFEDTKEVYDYCYENGSKGCTIFRPNPIREGILIDPNKSIEEEIDFKILLSRGDIIEPSDDLIGKKTKIQTGCGSLHIQTWFDPDTGELVEIFLSKGSTGGCERFMVGLSRMMSLAARGGIGTLDILDQLYSTGTCSSYAVRTATLKDTSKGNSCPSGIANAIKKMYEEVLYEINDDEIEEVKEIKQSEKKEDKNKVKAKSQHQKKCPECGDSLINQGGCIQCNSCGWSKCG